MNNNDELLNGIIDVPNQNNSQNTLEYNFNFESQVNQTPVAPAPNYNTLEQSSVNQTITSENIQTNNPEIILDPEVKQTNEEILNDLNDDTNDFVNPNLIVNPSINKTEEQLETLKVEEPRVNYEEITEKKNYMFMFIIFAIIILFIIFLPQIASLIGF